MPESEMFKMVMQGGMLALWIFFGWWCLTRGVPMLKEEISKMTTSHQQMVKDLTGEFTRNTENLNLAHKDACLTMSTAHRDAVNSLNTTHREVVTQLANECREERKEMMHIIYSKLGVTDSLIVTK